MVAALADADAYYKWLRGRCEVRDGVVYLDGDNVEPYRLTKDLPIIQDLANLYPDITNNLKAFVKSYGLLCPGEEQSLSEIEEVAKEFRFFIGLHRVITKAAKGDQKSLESLNEMLSQALDQPLRYHRLGLLTEQEVQKFMELRDQYIEDHSWTQHKIASTGDDRLQIIEGASRILARSLSQRMAGVTPCLASETTWANQGMMNARSAQPGVFMFEHRVESLFDFAYLRLAYHVARNEFILQCPMCGNFFERGQRLKTFCSKRCGVQSRKKRMNDRRKAQQLPLT